ncbi:tRNA pseudouridine(38-40) synthase TruA [Geoglobus acetivorans]|uniref:tRNA pseudouridine synthase A n=1 Tax=Geoglobus acetivorans TaxID=565033 RepID=A0A0A7GAX6_GEOAI|nr:tRNA pseudouridine synthase A [Geoglobus acetivorans]
MLRVAFKYAYFGWDYYGNQFQPHLRTVDGEIFRAFEKLGINARERRYRIAGRTDAGVSAFGNVFAVNLDSFEPWFLRVLNSNLPDDISVWAYCIVDEDFNPRKALSRVYRYVLPDEGFDVGAMKNAAQMLLGKHDFSGFAKACKPCVREILRSEIEKRGDFIIYTVEGNAFAWNMVRKIVTALKIAGMRSDTEIVELVLSGENIPLTPASPYGLILLDVKYPFEFKKDEKIYGLLQERIQERMKKFAQLYGIFRFLR